MAHNTKFLTVSAAQQATKTIPIVMGSISDPVASGFVKSLARPGGNITGLANALGDVMTKQVDLLHQTVPALVHAAVLMTRSQSHPALVQQATAAAHELGIKVSAFTAVGPSDIDAALTKMVHANVQAVIVLQDPLMTQQRQQLAERTQTHRLPSMFAYREYVEAGGLMSYGQNNVERYRRAAVYVDKILRGAKPSDLPVEQPTMMELVINLRTARLLGLDIPRRVGMIAHVVE